MNSPACLCESPTHSHRDAADFIICGRCRGRVGTATVAELRAAMAPGTAPAMIAAAALANVARRHGFAARVESTPTGPRVAVDVEYAPAGVATEYARTASELSAILGY